MGRGDRQAPALAPPGGDQRQPGGGRVAAGRVHGAGRVGEQPRVVVRARVGDAAGHESGGARRAVVAGVRGVRAEPSAALAAGVHDQVDMPGAAPGQPVERVTAAATVADVLHHHRGARRPGVRHQQPRLDRVPAETGETDVEHLGVPQHAGHHGELRCPRGGPGGGELAGPELVEVGGLGHVGHIAAEFGKRKVGEHGKERNGADPGDGPPEPPMAQGPVPSSGPWPASPAAAGSRPDRGPGRNRPACAARSASPGAPP